MALDEIINSELKCPPHLAEMLNLGFSSFVKDEVSEDRLREYIDKIRNKIAFYREYPDLFIDDIKGPDSIFKFRYVQRIYLRAVMRHRYVYCTFTRGFSKSFLAIMCLMIKAVLFPGSKLFVTTGGRLKCC